MLLAVSLEELIKIIRRKEMPALKYSIKTDKGLKRDVNQDAGFVTLFNDSTLFAVVCDGMGGSNAGEVASEMAVKNISERFIAGWRKGISFSSVSNLMITSFSAANICIYDEAAENSQLQGMGTTAVAAYIDDNRILIANVGDSRVYLLHCSKLTQVTKDNSLVQELLDNGQISASEIDDYPYKNVITRALGVDEHVELDFYDLFWNNGDKLLICSDGLYNFVDDEVIQSILLDDDVKNKAEMLINTANNNGGGDNITAVVLAK